MSLGPSGGSASTERWPRSGSPQCRSAWRGRTPEGWSGASSSLRRWSTAPGGRRLSSRIATMSLVELRKIRHDRTELYMRAIQPALWLLIFGETFTRIHAIPTTNGIPYLDYLAPGVMAQSALFISIFYGIQIIWERDFGILTKLLA